MISLRSALEASGSSCVSISSPSIPARRCSSARLTSWPKCSSVSRQQRNVGIMASTRVPSTSKMKTSALVQTGSDGARLLIGLEGSLRTPTASSSPPPLRAQQQRLDQPQRHERREGGHRDDYGHRGLMQPLFDCDIEIADDPAAERRRRRKHQRRTKPIEALGVFSVERNA